MMIECWLETLGLGLFQPFFFDLAILEEVASAAFFGSVLVYTKLPKPPVLYL